MIISMTGFGKASKSFKKMNISIELRSINSKFLEVSSRLPMAFNDRESEIKEMIGKYATRGKVTVQISIDRKSENAIGLKIEPAVVKDYYTLLNQIKKAAGLKEEIRLEHILKFSEIFKADDSSELKDYWDDVKKTFIAALKDLHIMKKAEGKTLEKDMIARIDSMYKKLGDIVKISDKNIKDNKDKLNEKVNNLLNGTVEIDRTRLEYELTMISDRMDITEEVIRAKSHINYFKNNVKEPELSGRRLNFLVQEINREINTIASKSNNSSISQYVVEMKEELEKIKEQLQNVE